MKERGQLEVAVLLATFNGARYIEPQIRSLGENNIRFSLHWLDDHSTDDTRKRVRTVASKLQLDLRERHQEMRQGVPGAFFHLLECVDADIYLFCDQDDIWQAGKIDATVSNLLPDLKSPALCFSDPLLFRSSQPELRRRVLEVFGTNSEIATKESRVFTPLVGYGHTEGFTRPLRELFLRHKDIARAYAFMHDVWMYAIAVASGTARILSDAPTTLYRQHDDNVSGGIGKWSGKGVGRITMTWGQIQTIRRGLARHAQGFILASSTLPQKPALERLLCFAKLVSTLDRRLSPSEVITLVRRDVMLPNARLALRWAAACLFSEAKT